MSQRTSIVLSVIFILFLGILILRKDNRRESIFFPSQYHMKIESPVFAEGGQIPPQYTCDGEDYSPELIISDVPEGTKSFVLIVDDPDASSGNWVHWTMWNIVPETRVIKERTVPLGAVEGETDFKKPGYGGPCPARGNHRYYFKLYALDTLLSLPVRSTKSDIEAAIVGHSIAEASVMGRYEREKK